MKRELAARFGGGQPALALANPISADLDAMRPSILPNLLQAAARNVARGQADPGLFEVGPQYASDEAAGQHLMATGLRVGQSGPRHWAAAPRAFDAFDAKADALAVLAALGLPTDNLQTDAAPPAWYHPGRAGTLRLGGNRLAHFGELHPAIVADLDLVGVAVGFEVFLDRVPLPRARGTARPPLAASPFQPVERDFAFLVDRGVAAEAVLRAVRGADKALIVGVGLFDRYEGQGVPEGKKSLAVSVTLQPTERTLTDAEIEAVAARIVAAAQKATGAELRR